MSMNLHTEHPFFRQSETLSRNWRNPFLTGLILISIFFFMLSPREAQSTGPEGSVQSPFPVKTPIEVLYPIARPGALQTNEALRRLGPLMLVRPLSEEALNRLYDEADSHYHGRAQRQAEEALLQLLELAPNHVAAWLRLGNLFQQRGETTLALRAYRRCVDLSQMQGQESRDAGYKALYNIASMSLGRALEAVQEVERWQVKNGERDFRATAPQLGNTADLKSMVEAITNGMNSLQPQVLPSAVYVPPAGAQTVSAGSSERVPVYQGWAKRRQPGHRQLAMPPDDTPKKGQSPSKPVLRASDGVLPAEPRIEELSNVQAVTKPPQQVVRPALPEVIYLKGNGDSTDANTTNIKRPATGSIRTP